MKSKGKVFVGLSGGVDSSVTAALLKQQGYEVTGVFIKVWEPPGYPCTWREDRRDAMRVAAVLDIPLVTLDLEKEYKRDVVDYLIREYRAGRTPNPDVMCNRTIKFGAFYQWAMKHRADYVATGHYARISLTPSPSPKERGKIRVHPSPLGKGQGWGKLLKASDPSKDQSYFLWTLKPQQLSYILFPIGDYQKSAVRQLAKKFKLPTATKKDSQGLCFIGKFDFKEFLKGYLKPKPGKVLNEAGKVIGQHDGAALYTIGERHGFNVTTKSPADKPYYIIGKDIKRNSLIVSNQQNVKHPMFNKTPEIELENVNWLVKPKVGKTYQAQIRYHGEFHKCTIKSNTKHTVVQLVLLSGGVATGQSLVIYDGEIMVGGGVIA